MEGVIYRFVSFKSFNHTHQKRERGKMEGVISPFVSLVPSITNIRRGRKRNKYESFLPFLANSNTMKREREGEKNGVVHPFSALQTPSIYEHYKREKYKV